MNNSTIDLYSYEDYQDFGIDDTFLQWHKYSKIIEKTQLYGFVTILLTGIVTNIFTLVVFTGSSLRTKVASQYFAPLAIIDIAVLLLSTTRYIRIAYDGFDIRTVSSFICKGHVFLCYSALQLSAWYIVSISRKRYHNVRNPIVHHLSRAVGRAPKNWQDIYIIIPMLIIANSYWIFIVDKRSVGSKFNVNNESTFYYYECTYTNDKFYRAAVIFDLFMTTMIPFIMIVYYNSSLLRHLTNHSTLPLLIGVRSVQARQSLWVNRSLILVAGVFISTNLPISVYLLIENLAKATFEFKDAETHFINSFIFHVLLLLQYSNNSVNILLYSIGGKNFRDAIRHLFRRRNNNCFHNRNRTPRSGVVQFPLPITMETGQNSETRRSFLSVVNNDHNQRGLSLIQIHHNANKNESSSECSSLDQQTRARTF